jgi:hypothetical protein
VVRVYQLTVVKELEEWELEETDLPRLLVLVLEKQQGHAPVLLEE